MAINKKAIKVFLSYAHEDEAWCTELNQHLGALKHESIIKLWTDHEISPGEPWNERIRSELDSAAVILLLISPAFLNSKFCWREEMLRAIERHRAGVARVIPIVVEECYWEPAPFAKLQGLPKNMKAVKSFRTDKRAAVWREVAEGIHKTIEELVARLPGMLSTEFSDDEGRGVASKIQQYLPLRAQHFQQFLLQPLDLTDREVGDRETVANLRSKLLLGVTLERPKLLTVEGTLFPCALLSSGWWERQIETKTPAVSYRWRNRIQEWLFNGFDLWAPSWDFTWTLDDGLSDAVGPRFIAQLGSGDEADSLPVVIPESKTTKLREWFAESWGGADVEITGLLGQRDHFPKCKGLTFFGGVLDYCLWLDEAEPLHKIRRSRISTALYSGYLWKCVVPHEWMQGNQSVRLRDAYFIWDHTNFAADEAVKYSLDALEHKENYLRRMHGDLVLIQKSSNLVPGKPLFPTRKAYNIIIGDGEEV
jgi:hypothetical protein